MKDYLLLKLLMDKDNGEKAQWVISTFHLTKKEKKNTKK
jgi:hypothetical protein